MMAIPSLDAVIQAVGYLAAFFVFTASAQRMMIRLRVLNICGNVCFLIYGLYAYATPIVVLHALLLPVNVWRLMEMRRLSREVATAADTDLNMDWLRPYMMRQSIAAGRRVFGRGDLADEFFIIESGRFRLEESGIELQAGELVGEMGLLAPDGARTQSLDCVEGGALLAISYAQWRVLYFQNPHFGFFFLRLVSRRLMANVTRAEGERDQARAERDNALAARA